nr:hypothetical protein [Aquisediminimonas sediminicola]
MRALVAAELGQPVDPRVVAFAADIAGRYGAAAEAVLFYGSCLRETKLDGLMLDFYLIVNDYRAAYPQGWMAVANQLVPPNVFPASHAGLIAKYAVLSVEDFARLNRRETLNVSVWARFAQPSRLVWQANEAAGERAVDAVAEAAPTLLAAALPLTAQDDGDPLAIWRMAFALTYGAELRAERKTRAGSVVDADPARYLLFTPDVLASARLGRLDSPVAARRRWRLRRLQGKSLTVLRLLKASLTYAGGIDYLAWKISRHSGHAIVIRPWQRRWPILGAITLLPRLVKHGAVR